MENQTNNHVKIGKKRILLIALAVCCIAALATGTVAYFTAEETAYNVITMGQLEMELCETTADGQPWPENGVSGVMPGMTVDKIVTVKNTGGVDFYARISLEMIVLSEDGEYLPVEPLLIDINQEDWTIDGNYYYYNRALAPGEETEPLFTAVTFGPEMGNEYMNSTAEIAVNAQAVQSRNNSDSALTAVGWADAD